MSRDSARSNDAASSELKSKFITMQQQFESFRSDVCERLDQLALVCATSLKSSDKTSIPLSSNVSVDRSLNLIVFGVKEDRSADIWCRRVDDILSYVTGKSVNVVDLFQLGRFSADKTRPVVLKLPIVWDKRFIPSKCMNLKHYTERGILIAADEPIDVRRKNTFDRLKNRAEREWKSVGVVDRILPTDGNAVFSLTTGHINSHGV